MEFKGRSKVSQWLRRRRKWKARTLPATPIAHNSDADAHSDADVEPAVQKLVCPKLTCGPWLWTHYLWDLFLFKLGQVLVRGCGPRVRKPWLINRKSPCLKLAPFAATPSVIPCVFRRLFPGPCMAGRWCDQIAALKKCVFPFNIQQVINLLLRGEGQPSFASEEGGEPAGHHSTRHPMLQEATKRQGGWTVAV